MNNEKEYDSQDMVGDCCWTMLRERPTSRSDLEPGLVKTISNSGALTVLTLTSTINFAPLAKAVAMAMMVAGSSSAANPFVRATSVCLATSAGGCVLRGAVRAATLAPVDRQF